MNAEQLAFELDALGRAAIAHAVLFDDDEVYVKARTGMRARLRAAAADSEALP